MKSPDEDWSESPQQESVEQRGISGHHEETFRSDEAILNGCGVVADGLLTRPLMVRIGLLTRQIILLRIEDPSDRAIVDGSAYDRTEKLGEEHGPGRYVHVMSDLLVL